MARRLERERVHRSRIGDRDDAFTGVDGGLVTCFTGMGAQTIDPIADNLQRVIAQGSWPA